MTNSVEMDAQAMGAEEADAWHLKLIPNTASKDAAKTAKPKIKSKMDLWFDKVARLQTKAAVIAHVMVIVNVVFLIGWIKSLGGLPPELTIYDLASYWNWHPFFMILGFCCMTVATLAFRQPYRSAKRSTNKLLHTIEFGVGAIFGLISILFIGNLKPLFFYSMHAWIGVFTITTYLVQFFVAIFSFTFPCPGLDAVTKAQITRMHKWIGNIIYISALATIIVGIEEKDRVMLCVAVLPPICWWTNVFGACIFLMGLLTIFSTHDFKKT